MLPLFLYINLVVAFGSGISITGMANLFHLCHIRNHFDMKHARRTKLKSSYKYKSQVYKDCTKQIGVSKYFLVLKLTKIAITKEDLFCKV